MYFVGDRSIELLTSSMSTKRSTTELIAREFVLMADQPTNSASRRSPGEGGAEVCPFFAKATKGTQTSHQIKDLEKFGGPGRESHYSPLDISGLRSRNPRFLVSSDTGKTFLFPDPLLRSIPQYAGRIYADRCALHMWAREGSNLRPQSYQDCALPLSHWPANRVTILYTITLVLQTPLN